MVNNKILSSRVREIFLKVYVSSLVFISFIAAEQCCSIIIPPVTITGQKTAIEKQIIGDQAELEKDVWMISSAKTSSKANLDGKPEDAKKKIEQENANTYQAFIKFEAFGSKLAQLKKDRVVGENNKGFISNLFLEKITLPAEMIKKYDASLAEDPDKGVDYRTLIETVKQINLARSLAGKGYIENQKRANPSFKSDEKEVMLVQKEKYQDAAMKGEYIQNAKGEWYNKQ